MRRYRLMSVFLAVFYLCPETQAAEQKTILVGHIQTKIKARKLKDRDFFDTLLTTAIRVAAPKYSVTSMGDLASQLEFEHLRERMGCDTQACLAEIAGSTGADFVVFPKLMQRGKRFYFQITFIDRKRSRVVSSSSLLKFEWSGESFEAIIEKAVADVFGGAPAPSPAPAVPNGYMLIQPGSFMMGSPSSESGRDNDEKQHRVTITRPFFLKATEVTQGEWNAVMGSNPSKFSSCGDDCPVEKVSWYDAVDYVNALSRKEGLEQCYHFGRFKGLSCKGYRLPTEAEWEYAARAGSTEARYGDLNSIAWYNNNSGRKTHPVGEKKPNAWGLFDMIGNVWEWTNDWQGDYPDGALSDPVGRKSGSFRVRRGGCWSFGVKACRAAGRAGNDPDVRGKHLGFRPARTAH